MFANRAVFIISSTIYGEYFSQNMNDYIRAQMRCHQCVLSNN